MYEILSSIKEKTLKQVKQNYNLYVNNSEELHYIKRVSLNMNIWVTAEKSFTTHLGYALQEIAANYGNGVENVDKTGRKSGIDLKLTFENYEGQLKTGKNTQTGTHRDNSITKLKETCLSNATKPFFAIAISSPFTYVENGVLHIGGKLFWEWIGVDYNKLFDTIIQILVETENEIKSTYGHLL